MKFSIVIPLYNKQAYIRRAIYSAFDQIGFTQQQCEIIIVDDGSSDESLAIVKKIQAENSSRKIIVHTQANAGVSRARNKGVELANSKYIAFLDADDTYEPNFLREIKSLIVQYPKAVMYCTAYQFINTSAGIKRDASFAGIDKEQSAQLLKDYFLSASMGDLPVTSSSVCIRKDALIGVGGFPCSENMGEDQAVWSQIALKHPIAISQKVCANYFEATPSSLMQTNAPKSEMPFSTRLQQQLDQRKVESSKVSSIQSYIAGHLIDLVRRNIKSGDLKRAKIISSDLRARRQQKRWLYWSLRLRIEIFRKSVLSKLSKNVET